MLKKRCYLVLAATVALLGCVRTERPLESREAYVKGRQLYLEEKLADAQGAFRLSMEKDPEFLPARFMLAKTHIFLQQWDAAEQELQTLLSSRGDHRDARFWLARVFYLTNRPTKAEEALKPLFEVASEDPLVVGLMAQIRQDLGDYAGALELYQNSLTGKYEIGLLFYRLGQLYDDLQLPEKALPYYQEALRLFPETHFLYTTIREKLSERTES